MPPTFVIESNFSPEVLSLVSKLWATEHFSQWSLLWCSSWKHRNRLAATFRVLLTRCSAAVQFDCLVLPLHTLLRRNWKLLCLVLHTYSVTWRQRLCILGRYGAIEIVLLLLLLCARVCAAYCGGVLDARYNGTIYSPGYPSPGYRQDVHCSWLIKVMSRIGIGGVKCV